METNTYISKNKNQINQVFSDNNSFQEPNIRKAKFIVSSSRIYTLEFDQNIEMQELKIMIQKAAHLSKINFSLFIDGEDYTHYTDETFDSLFPDQTLVVFTLELGQGEENLDETELLLQINMPCPEHDYKFLLYYCYDCGKSICSECFTNGPHKGHKIQDKCFYLLPSKYLVEKMFENWSKKPYEDFQISVDLSEYKNKLNIVMFNNLFQMLKDIQIKCNNLIDKYNTINQNSLSNLRDSVRDIKISCIKALDEYKDLVNIKDIINNQEVFIDFDHTYKEMGIKQKEKFRENLQKFQELNKGISILVENLINDVYNMINNALIKSIDNKQYEDIEQKINLKLINPVNKDDIINQISDKKIKIKKNKKERKTLNNNYKRLVGKISEGVELELEKENEQDEKKGRNTIIPQNLNSNNTFENNFDIEKSSNGRKNDTFGFNDLNRNTNNKNNNSIDSILKNKDEINHDNGTFSKNNIIPNLNNNNNLNTINISQINNFNKKNNNDNQNSNLDSSNNQTEILDQNQNMEQSIEKEENTSYRYNDNNNLSNNPFFNNNQNNNLNYNPFLQSINNKTFINNKHINQNGKESNTNYKEISSQNIFSSILDKNNNNNDNNNYFDNISNKKLNSTFNMNSINTISPIKDNRAFNQNNGNTSINSSFNYDINNINNNTQENKEKENIKINLDNDNNYVKNPFSFGDNNNKSNSNQIIFGSNTIPQNFSLSSPFTDVNTNNTTNIYNKDKNNKDNNINNSSENKNVNMNKRINENNRDENDSKYLEGLAKNCKTILEEANESESELKIQKEKKINIEYYLNKAFILCPIPTTNKVKIITDKESDENIISLNFPEDFSISSFLNSCAYCNHNKKLYISGGSSVIYNINRLYMIDLYNKNDKTNSYIYELSPMIYNRCNHSMIAEDNDIYVVGGEDTNTVEKYDIINDKWIELNGMVKKRSNTMLAIDNGYLYAFFGKGEFGKYPESIERLNIKNNKSIWEMILFSNPSNIDTRLYGCGIHKLDELIYFFGGKRNEEPIDKIFFFNLNERRIDYTDANLKWKESFRENKLFEIGNKMVQITEGKYFGIYLKIKTL